MRSLLACVLAICSAAEARTPKEIFTRAAQSAVRVRRGGKSPGAGSGVIVEVSARVTRVLTCAHVVGKETVVKVDFDEEGLPTETALGVVERTDEKADLALIMLVHRFARALPTAVAMVEPDDYDDLYIVASALGGVRQSNLETLNTKDMVDPDGHYWTFSGFVAPGMSGGALLNRGGDVVCLVDALADAEYPGYGLCIPLPSIRAFLYLKK
jgi:S1-C subfamily serine protease